MAPKTLLDLPSEVIHQILLLLPPTFLPTLELVSKQINEFTKQPVIWRHHCQSYFQFWNSARNIRAKWRGNVADVDWNVLYTERHRADRSVSYGVDSILSTQNGRGRKASAILEFGYEAKDTLLRHCNARDDAADVLARRSVGIEQWQDLRKGRRVPLEHALAAFDLFVSENDEEDLDTISQHFETLAQGVREQSPNLADQTLRQQAITIAEHLRRNNFRGIRRAASYYDLPNNFIGLALQDEEHQTLPLVLVAIYCCVAQRLGLDAQPCGFPLHVLAIIRSSDDHDLDGRHVGADTERPCMYMDPWTSSEEMPREELIARLRAMKTDPSDYPALLGSSSTTEIVRRTARNIVNSVKNVPSVRRDGVSRLPSNYPDPNTAFYAALWALLMLSEGDGDQTRVQGMILHHIERDFPLDLGLFEKYALPLCRPQYNYSQLHSRMERIRAEDDEPKKCKSRNLDTRENVHYKVGQVFKHKRYHYVAIITGWDVECEAGEDWIARMSVRSLPGGQHQAFYHVMVEDQSIRYVAEENIQIMKPDALSTDLMTMAGQHFKRWDSTSKRFVSNLRDEYPDD